MIMRHAAACAMYANVFVRCACCDVPRRIFGTAVRARHRRGPSAQAPPPRGPPQAGLWPLVLSPAEPGTRGTKGFAQPPACGKCGKASSFGAKSDDRRADACITVHSAVHFKAAIRPC
jgi:hypothetical protein